MLCPFEQLFVLADPITGGDPGNEPVIDVPQPGLATQHVYRWIMILLDLNETPPGLEPGPVTIHEPFTQTKCQRTTPQMRHL